MGVETAASREREIADFFALLLEKFELDHKKLRRQQGAIQKMAWEQVLLLVIYSRQFLWDEQLNAENIGRRARLILIDQVLWICRQQQVDQKEVDYRLLYAVLERLDNQTGSMELSRWLWEQSATGEDETWSARCKALLTAMEKNAIVFTSNENYWTVAPCYSWFALYRAYKDPFSFFQPLLCIPDYSQQEMFYPRLLAIMKSYIHENYAPNHYLFTEQTHEDRLFAAYSTVQDSQSLETFLGNFPDAFDSDRLREWVQAELMKELAESVYAAFSQSKPPASQPVISAREQTPFESLCQSQNQGKDFILTFERSTLDNLMRLGHIDDVMKQVRTLLLNRVTPAPVRRRFYGIVTRDYADAFVALSRWYQQCKTPLFTRLEQVPLLVASVIVLDVRQRHGFLSPVLTGNEVNWLPKKLTAHQVADITTLLIDNCLFYRHFSFKVTGIAFGGDILGSRETDSVADMLERAERHFNLDKAGGQRFTNPMMQQWLKSENPQSALERIKKIHHYYRAPRTPKQKVLRAKFMIDEQRQAGASGRAPYPLSTVFPLPLWARLDSVQGNDDPPDAVTSLTNTEAGEDAS